MNNVEIVILLLIVVAALAIVAKRMDLPYPILLVITGLVLGFVPGLPPLKLEPEVLLLFVLPPLLYPAALFTSWRDFRANLRPILLLAIGLVLVTTLAIGFVAHALGGLPCADAILLRRGNTYWVDRHARGGVARCRSRDPSYTPRGIAFSGTRLHSVRHVLHYLCDARVARSQLASFDSCVPRRG